MRNKSRILFSLVAFFGLLLVSVPDSRGDSIGFFYALDADLQGLKTVARESGQSITVGTRIIQRLQMDSHVVYAVKMGSGAVETAISAQALLGRFRCDWAFSLGPAGALSPEIETGRCYRVSRMLAWQKIGANDGETGAASLPAWSIDWNDFPVAMPSSWLSSSSEVVVASGEQFISTCRERERLQAATQADVVDMNSYGLAAACADHGVPLYAWKAISDRADENAGESFRNFVSSYSGQGGQALAGIIQSLPANPNDPASYPAIRRLLEKATSTPIGAKPPQLTNP